jgi:hypothetical protein
VSSSPRAPRATGLRESSTPGRTLRNQRVLSRKNESSRVSEDQQPKTPPRARARPGVEHAPESSSSRGPSWNHTSRGSGVRARNERKKIEESEGHIAKRMEFSQLKKKKTTPVSRLPLGRALAGAPLGTTCPASSVGKFKKSGKKDEL